MTYIIQDLVEALRARRREKGLSQRDLGQRVGLPQSHISKIEKGSSDIKLSSLMEMARALDLEVMLVPRSAFAAVNAIIQASTLQQEGDQGSSGPQQIPAYRLDEDDDA